MTQRITFFSQQIKYLLFGVFIASMFSACVVEDDKNDSTQLDKTGSVQLDKIDFSHYESENITVKPESGVIVNGRLYAVLQVFSNGWTPELGIVAVIDTATNEEIDTDPTVDGIQPIYLTVSNPEKIVYRPNLEKLFIQASGRIFQTDDKFSAGGVVTIDINSYDAELLIDDTAETLNIYKMAIVSDTVGYYVGYVGWGDNNLYEFNPSNGDIASSSITSFDGKSISDIEVDKDGKLWIATTGTDDLGIYILDTTSNTVDGNMISTSLPPANITFATVPSNDTTSENQTLAILSTYIFEQDGFHATVSVDADRTLTEQLGKTLSTDFRFVAYGNYFYKLDNTTDSIQQYSTLDSGTVINEQSILGDDISANPHDLVFSSETKAYVFRYDGGDIWVIDPTKSQ